MESAIKMLVSLIREEEDLLSDFLDLLEEQKQILIRNDIEEFEDTARKQEEMIVKIRHQEEQRMQIVQGIAAETNQEVEDVTLTRLVEMSLGQVSTDLASAKKSVNGLVKRIKRVSEVNQYLIRRSLNTTQKAIDWLIDDAENDIQYDPSGFIKGKETRSLLVNKTL